MLSVYLFHVVCLLSIPCFLFHVVCLFVYSVLSVCLFRVVCLFYTVCFMTVCLSVAECLEELGLLIQDNGMTVCGTQPHKSLPTLAAQIKDRDNAVRSAALNTMVVVYSYVGEGVYKFTEKVGVCVSTLWWWCIVMWERECTSSQRR